mmetsp:Transcript_17604/g.42411  ORF Transcript_17604/g.42411 Transcript_17604/m.42411 type:complete len:238 (+) Transcript_17604:968-1681(+)
MRPRPPEDPEVCFVMKLSSSPSIAVMSASNMNSWGTSGSGSACSSLFSGSSGSSGSSVSSSTSSSVFSLSWGGGGGGGCIICSISSGCCMNFARGAITSLTASLRSSALTGRSASAALARATSHAKISARCPWTPAREASLQRYSICFVAIFVSLSSSRAKRICVLSACSFSNIDSIVSGVSVFSWNPVDVPTASTRSSSVRGLVSAESATAMRSRRCCRSSASSGLNVAMRSGRQG